MTPLCESCDVRPSVVERDGSHYCQRCDDRRTEDAAEQQAASYYAGGGLWAERQRTDEARRVK